MERLDQDLKNKNFQHLYLLYGEEAYLRQNYKKALIKAIMGDDTMNQSSYIGKDINVGALIDQAETMPFFGDKRLILIEDSGFLKNSGGEALADYIKEIPEYLYIIIVEAEVDKRSKFFKACTSAGSAVLMEPYKEGKMKQWIGSVLKQNSKKMTESDVEYLLQKTGDDMVNIRSELEKLINFTGERDVITRNDIDEIVIRQIGDCIFDLVEAMGNRKQTKALEYYYDLLARREAPFKILALIGRQFNILLQTKELIGIRSQESEIASKVKVPPFTVRKYIQQARMYDMKTLVSAIEACAQADEDIKTGKMQDRMAVELLIVEYSRAS
ncbi:MAG: DNA polymerase III subunit delta [Lachnospiraceae bacterium]|nr:DNA polymerase III subunit delta [Lachnospiraceae bacterium]